MFALLVADLIHHAFASGYEITLGDAYRDPRCHGEIGIKKAPYGRAFSNHKCRLAIDLNLFKDGVYLYATNDHRFLGEWWEKLDARCRWGGHFGDGNHYSFEYEGRQ